MPFDVDGARLLCQVISGSCGRRGMVFATNVELSRWGTVLAGDKPAAAIVGRVVRHGGLVELGGPGHRFEEPPMLGKLGSWRRARDRTRRSRVPKPERFPWPFPKEMLTKNSQKS